MINKLINRLDKSPLWILGVILEVIVLIPFDILGKRSAFVWHDQMDETILHYVFSAKHMFDGLKVYPEMMSGLSKTAFQPNAYLFVPLYRIFDPFVAFLLSYAVIFAFAFYGMYALVKKLTSSSIIALICAGLFAMLPFYPVYGGAVAGVPMAAYAIICLSNKEKKVLSYILLTLYVLTAHLILSGYAVLGLWALFLLYKLVKKSLNRYEVIGFVGTIILYIIMNLGLFIETLSPADSFTSHREEFINTATPFFDSLKEVFISGSMHAESFHEYIIIPVILMLILGFIWTLRGKFSDKAKALLKTGLITFLTIILISLLFAAWNSVPLTAFKNSRSGILRNFQLDRFYWLLPAMWYALLGICLAMWWANDKLILVRTVIIALMVLPTALLIKDNSLFYMAINQMNNGSDITGYITWEAYYSEDVMGDIDAAIGRDKTTYRVAHIGMNPTPALMHGFYTIDGYSNSYPLDYKHKIREVIADELSLSPASADYFDHWGSRCYLYNSQSGTSFMNGKKNEVTYSDLKYDYKLLKDMGCEYLFSCGEILDAPSEGLEFIGAFTSDTSYWKVWVYKIS